MDSYDDIRNEIYEDILYEEEAKADTREVDPGQEMADRFSAMAHGEYPEEPEEPEAPDEDPAQVLADKFSELAHIPRDAFGG